MKKLLGMCLDWRVLGALALVAVAVWVFVPQLAVAALPVLLLLVCPLSMLVMAWTMRGSSMGSMDGAQLSTADRLAMLERERARIDGEIARIRAEPSTPGGERAESEASS